jgi:hypothetical protein
MEQLSPCTTTTKVCVLCSLEATTTKSVHRNPESVHRNGESVHRNRESVRRSGGFHTTQGRSHVLQLRANVAKVIKKTKNKKLVLLFGKFP